MKLAQRVGATEGRDIGTSTLYGCTRHVDTARVAARLTARVAAQVAARVAAGQSAPAAGEWADVQGGLFRNLGQKRVSGQLNKVIRVLLADGTTAYTIPDKPQSRQQKYHLTGV